MNEQIALRNTCLACCIALWPHSSPAQEHEIVGPARITDGDTVIIGDTKIRLRGIDAPETDQICLDKAGQDWECGIRARDALIERVGKNVWQCRLQGLDAYGRALGTCHVNGEDVNHWMVSQGWALAFVKYSQVYVPAEIEAKSNQRGMWSGAFIAPWDWRRKNCETSVLSLSPISLEGHRRLCGSPAIPPSPQCAIKANLKPQECIYHVPGGRHYGKLAMDGPKRRWFCSTEEAEAAGCRPAKN